MSFIYESKFIFKGCRDNVYIFFLDFNKNVKLRVT